MAKYRRRYRRWRSRSNSNADGILAIFGFLLFAGFVQGLSQGSSPSSIVGTLAILIVVIFGMYILKLHLDTQKRLKRDRMIQDLAQIRSMSPVEFEHYIKRVFERMGYKDIQVTKRAKDNGIDHFFTYAGNKYAIQTKRYAFGNNVSEPMLRDFYGSFVDNHAKGLFITTSDFTREAKIWAANRPTLILWNGEKLIEKIQGRK